MQVTPAELSRTHQRRNGISAESPFVSEAAALREGQPGPTHQACARHCSPQCWVCNSQEALAAPGIKQQHIPRQNGLLSSECVRSRLKVNAVADSSGKGGHREGKAASTWQGREVCVSKQVPIMGAGHFVGTWPIETKPTHYAHCGQKQEERMTSPRNVSFSQTLIKLVTFREDHSLP